MDDKPTHCRTQLLTHRHHLRLGMLTACILAAASLGRADQPRVQRISKEQAAEYKLTDYYKKGTLVHNVLIISSDRVSDFAHLEAAYQIDQVMKNLRPDVARRIRERGVLCILVGCTELVSDLPHYPSKKTGKELDFYNWRNRGNLGTKNGRPTALFSEEDVLEYEGGMQLESILIHEFGHVIDAAGLDKPLRERVAAAFENARAKGLYNDAYAAHRFRRVKSDKPVSLLDALAKSFPDQPRDFLARCMDGGSILVNSKPADSKATVAKDDKVLIVFGGPKQCYAGKNRAEYWAEGVQDWYDTNRTMDHDHSQLHTRDQLKTYDPELSKILAEVLGDRPWRFVSPRLRAGQGHLKGYDPDKAPKAVRLDHIEAAALDYYDKYWESYWTRLHEKYDAKSSLAAPSK
ncbi:MAG TPA: hypothetical protein PKG77_03305 [Phycisphaerae bacterium]|nr:hypothetical protein [Phycisphaerae bacterium]HQL72731.1 hypothetical protein [Phycisphaerae bacterium]